MNYISIESYPQQLAQLVDQENNTTQTRKISNNPQIVVDESQRIKRQGSTPETYFKITDHLDKGTVTINVKQGLLNFFFFNFIIFFFSKKFGN